MKVDHRTVKGLFTGNVKYKVPIYQRDYKWTNRLWKLLWEDILALAGLDEESKNKSNTKTNHFMGVLICLGENQNEKGLTECQLIDGQQRITTLLILLKAIEQVARRNVKYSELAASLKTLISNSDLSGDDSYKLIPNLTNKETFKKIISSGEFTTNSKDNVAKAYKYFLSEVNHVEKELQTLSEALVNQVILIQVILDAEDNPQEVFSRINWSREELSQADILKNYLLMNARSTEKQEQIITKYWQPMVKLLGDSDFMLFLKHFASAKRESFTVTRHVYYSIRQFYDDSEKRDPETFIQMMQNWALLYHKLLHPDELESTIGTYVLNVVNKLKDRSLYVFLLNLLEYFDTEDGDKAEFEATLCVLENWIMRCLLANESYENIGNNAPQLHKSILAKMEDGVSYSQAFKSHLVSKNRGLSYCVDVDLTTRRIEPINRANPKLMNDKLLIVLNRVEDFKSNQKMGTNQATFTLIMPLEVNDRWKNEIGPDEERNARPYTQIWGNYALTTDGVKEYDDFNVRKISFAREGFQINQSIQRSDKWLANDIMKRNNELFSCFEQIWPDYSKEHK